MFYAYFKGKIKNGYVIDHLCRNPSCVNPKHLEAVTYSTNTRRGILTKLNVKMVDKIKKLSKFYSQIKLAEMFGIEQSTISRILNGKRWL